MKIKTFVNNPFQENTYVVSDNDSKECVVIDPGMSNEWEWGKVCDYLNQEGLTLKAIWLTHCHVDHEMGTGYLADAYGVSVSGPLEDYLQLPTAEMQAQLFGVPFGKAVVPVTINIKEGDHLRLGGCEVEVYDVPGHSHHGLCYYFKSEEALFTGDVLFYGSIGRSDFGPAMGGNGELLVEGIRSKLMSLPPSTQVYPGHGPATSIGFEITHNAYF